MSGSPKRQGPPISFLPVSCNTEKRHKETAPLEKKLKKKKKEALCSWVIKKGLLGVCYLEWI